VSKVDGQKSIVESQGSGVNGRQAVAEQKREVRISDFRLSAKRRYNVGLGLEREIKLLLDYVCG